MLFRSFFELENGNLGIVIADIVGKGVPAGLFMATLKSLLNTHIHAFNSPKLALERINRILLNDPVLNKFIPMFYGILNPKTLSFTYCNAGHEPAILYSKGEFKDLDTDGFPLGGLQNSNFVEKKVTLSDDDIIIIFTDGIIEARDNGGTNYGRNRLKTLIKKH